MAGMISTEKYDAWMLARTKHGGYSGGRESPEHYIWRSMHARCRRESNKEYASYGGRGIYVCSRWNDFANFLNDMGSRPTAEHSLDRINNDGPYTPENCRWATRSEQQKNKRSTRKYTNGIFVGTSAECAAYIGVSRALASYRMLVWGTFEKGVPWCQLLKIE